MKRDFFNTIQIFSIFFIIICCSNYLHRLFSYYRSSRVIIDKAKAINSQKLEFVASNMNSIMSHVNEVSHLIIQNNDVKDYLRVETVLKMPPKSLGAGFSLTICRI